MELRAYFEQHDGRLHKEGAELQRIAVEVGIKPYYLYMMALGHKKAGALLARHIAAATDHAVPPSALRPDYFGPVQQKVA